MNIDKQEIIDNIKDIVSIDEIDMDYLINLAREAVDSGRLDNTKESILSFIRLAL